jgi:hypothetical protein
MPSETPYADWEPDIPSQIPERSRLYSLRPIGIGTSQVESLTGYVARLAEAHVLTVGDLVGREPLCTTRAGLCRRGYFHRKRPKGQVFHAQAYAINGTLSTARKWVNAFEQLTRGQGLNPLTLLPLRHTLSDMLLFKQHRAWCPQCYEEDHEKASVYERLLWALRTVTLCPIHATPLEDHCPFCYEVLPPLAVHSRPGHCSACGEWLGRAPVVPPRRGRDEASYELNVATAVGDLLAGQNNNGRLSAARFRRNLRICIRRLASGNMAAFAEFTHARKTTVCTWLSGKMLPRLDVLLRFSFHLGISASALLTSRGLAEVDWSEIDFRFSRPNRGVKGYRSRETVGKLLVAALRDDDCPSVPELANRLGYKRCESLRQVSPELCRRITKRHRACRRTHWWREPGAKRICELDRIRTLLEQSLELDYPVSVRRLAKQLGYAGGNSGFILRSFPDLCRSIAAKRRAWEERKVEQLRCDVRAALSEQPPPTLHELSQRFGFQTSTTLRFWVPDLADELMEKRTEHAAMEIVKLRTVLRRVLQEDPVPSFNSVARRLQRSTSFLMEKHPDLCHAIASRYLQQQKMMTRERRQLLDDEVLSIAKDLQAQGQNPTQVRIVRLLSNGGIKEWGAVQRAVKRARQFLGLR